MMPSLAALVFLASSCSGFNLAGEQEPLRAPIDPTKYRAACPDYKNYAMRQQWVQLHGSVYCY